MQTAHIAAGLEAFPDRGPGTDAERRAARWLASQLRASGRQVGVETFWCRPNWALAQAWHVGLALAGSLVSVASPRVGAALVLAGLAFLVMDELTGVSPGRRLTPERASQNVVARAQGDQSSGNRLRLILTANYDAGRTGLVYRDALRRPVARARRLAGRTTPGWLGWLALMMVWLEAVAILRLDGHTGTGISALQLPPTLALVVATALLLELASAGFGAAAGDNATGVAVALELTRTLDSSRHSHLTADLVLTGAGDGGIGLRAYMRAHRRELPPATTAVIGIAPCTAGAVHWWRADGPLLPLRYARRLRALSAQAAEEAAHLGARRRDGRGRTPALPARLARVPAIAFGCLDPLGLSPRSHQTGDTAAAVDPAAADAAVQFGVVLVDAIDAALAAAASPATGQASPTPA